MLVLAPADRVVNEEKSGFILCGGALAIIVKRMLEEKGGITLDYISEITKRVQLKEGKRVLEHFLIDLYLNEPLSTKVLAHHLLLPVPVTTAIKKEFIKLEIAVQKNGVQLTAKGRSYVEENMGYAGLDLDLYRALQSEEKFRERYIEKFQDDMKAVFDGRPQVNVALDQAFGTPETAIKRALLAFTNLTLIGKKLLCVGDDDLVSIALGYLLRDLFPRQKKAKTKIVVFDLDEGLLHYITKLAREYQFPIVCENINLKEALPLKYLNFFDCFYTDPPYTIRGLILFLSRGIGSLKREKGSLIYLSFGQKAVEENYQMQKEILNHGLSIKKIMESFNEYHGGSLLGNRSPLMILETTESTNALISHELAYSDPIYTREENPLERKYRCKQCKYEILMSTKGDTRFKTIEQLKSAGCPQCGSMQFDLINKRVQPVTGEKKSLGYHVIADFFDCDENVLKHTELVKEYMFRAAEHAHATIVTSSFRNFTPWGVSGMIIIKESHFTIHTWPEYRYAAVDLFTCGTSLELLESLKYLKEMFACENMEYSSLARGLFQNNHITSTVKVENFKLK